MYAADQQGIPFWPATSILDTPSLVLIWRTIKREAEAKAAPEVERIRARRADAQAQQSHHANPAMYR